MVLSNPIDGFTIINCLFGAVKLTKSSIKSTFIYKGIEFYDIAIYGIAFYGDGSWKFGDKFARKVFLVLTIVYQDILIIEKITCLY